MIRAGFSRDDLPAISREIFRLVALIYFILFISEDLRHHRSCPVCLSAGFSFSPANNRFLDRQYQGFPDGFWLATNLTSLLNSPANPPGMNRAL